MKIAIVCPIWITNAPLWDLATNTAKTWHSQQHQLGAFLPCNRLEGYLPEDLKRMIEQFGSLEVCQTRLGEGSVAGAWNQGWRDALTWGADRLVLCGADALWFKDSLDVLAAWDDPLDWLWAGRDVGQPESLFNEAVIPDVVIRESGFSMLMMRADLYKRVGWFDQHYWPAYFEDNDFAARVALAGGNFRTVNEARYYHHASATVRLDPHAKSEVERHFPLNAAYFASKWGVLRPANHAQAIRRDYFRTPFNRPELPLWWWEGGGEQGGEHAPDSP